MRFFLLFLVALTLCAKSAACSATDLPDTGKWERFDREIVPRMDFFDVPGAAIAVVDNGKLVLCKGYGLRDVNNKLPVDTHTSFQLASVSKFMLALTAGALVDDHKLGWNIPAERYYPRLNLSNSYIEKNVTIEDLLSHRSGLQPFDGDDLTVFGYTKTEILDRVKYLCLNDFRERAQYSNVGYLLAGEVIGRACGASWEQALTDKLLLPLKMSDSAAHFLDQNYFSTHPDYAKPYSYDFGARTNIPVNISDYDALGPAGSMASTIDDMSRVLLMLTNGGSFDGKTILTPETITQIYQPRIINNYGGPEGFDHGNNALGCNSYIFNNQTVVEKDGLLNGTCSVISIIPSANSGIVILCNTDMIDFRGAVRELFLEYVLGTTSRDLQKINYYDPWQNECAYSGSSHAPDTPQGAASPPLTLDKYCGVYKNDCYGAFTITARPEGLIVIAEHNKKTGRLIPQNSNRFIWYWPQNDDQFIMDFETADNNVIAAYGDWLGYLQKQ